METIKFSSNWNNKLNNKAFTTLRIHNEHKYKVGSSYSIILNSETKGTARILEIRRLRLDQLNEFICHLDTGYCKASTITILERMYKGTDLQAVLFDFCLLVYNTEKAENKAPNTANIQPNV